MVEIDKEYLTRKHRGGENSKKGNMFEAYFSVYQILLLMSEGKLDATLFSQVENAYVDDLLILQDDSSVYHQIKDVKSLSWGNIETKNTLAYDFYHQAELCLFREVKFLLKLIVSSGYEKMKESKPADIKDVTDVEEFPAYANINMYAYDAQVYSVAAKAIGVGDKQHYDVSTFVTMLFGKWCGGLCEGKTVKSIFLDVKRSLFGTEIDEKILDDILKLLGKMGFAIEVESSMLHWKYRGFEGDTELTESKIEEILASTDVESMINVLY